MQIPVSRRSCSVPHNLDHVLTSEDHVWGRGRRAPTLPPRRGVFYLVFSKKIINYRAILKGLSRDPHAKSYSKQNTASVYPGCSDHYMVEVWSSIANKTIRAEFHPDLSHFVLWAAYRVSAQYKRQKSFQTKYKNFYFEKSKIGSEFLVEID